MDGSPPRPAPTPNPAWGRAPCTHSWGLQCPRAYGLGGSLLWPPETQQAWLCSLPGAVARGKPVHWAEAAAKDGGGRQRLTTWLWTNGGAGNWAQLAGWDQPNTGFCRAGCTYKLRRWFTWMTQIPLPR